MFNFLRRNYRQDKPYFQLVRVALGTKANNIELYKLALLHRSASIQLEDGTTINNERLEFLGDAVLQAIVSELVFIEYPQSNEGSLTQIRSKLVSRESLNALALKIGIDKEIVAQPSTLNAGGKNNVYGDALEALIGALYLDKGYDPTNRILIRLINKHIDIDQLMVTEKDFKSRIIEWGQKERKKIEFTTATSHHHSERTPSFETILYVNGEPLGFGAGVNKKESEQRASKKLFESLEG